MENLFKEMSQKVLIFLSTESENDPFEHTKDTTELPGLPIRALVSDLNFSSLQWKLPGLMVDKAKELIIEKKYKSLIEKSYKIVIAGETDEYEGFKVGGKLSYKIEQDYIRCYIHIKKLE